MGVNGLQCAKDIILKELGSFWRKAVRALREIGRARRPGKEVLKTADLARECMLGVCGGQGSPLDSSRGERGRMGRVARQNHAQQAKPLYHIVRVGQGKYKSFGRCEIRGMEERQRPQVQDRQPWHGAG